MNSRVIEPSEIIVEQPNKPKENITHVNPWIRCIARFFDYSLFFLVLLITKKIFHAQLPFGKLERLIPFEFFIWVPVESILLSTWGTTPGKFFLKTRLKAGKNYRLNFMMALRRSFAVWLRGLGMGILGINFFCLCLAYQKLKIHGITSWDRDDHVHVTHYPIGRWRIYLAAFIAAAGILYYTQEKSYELKHAARIFQSVGDRIGINPEGQETARSIDLFTEKNYTT